MLAVMVATIVPMAHALYAFRMELAGTLGQEFAYHIYNDSTGGSSNSLTDFYVPIPGYQIGTAEFNTGAGWYIYSETPLDVNNDLIPDGYNVWMEPMSSFSHIQPGYSALFTFDSTATFFQDQPVNYSFQSGYSSSINVSLPYAVAVPEPATYALGAGVFALGFAAWRRRKL